MNIVIHRANGPREQPPLTLSFTGEPVPYGELGSDQRDVFRFHAQCDAEEIFLALRTRVPSATFDAVRALFNGWD